MKVIIDGNEVECLNDVKVIYDDQMDEDENPTQIHVTATYEGLIIDEFNNDGNLNSTSSMEVSSLLPSIY